MVKYFLIGVLCLSPSLCFAGKDISSSTVEYVYQLDSDATVFEFGSSIVSTTCGFSNYRVESPNVDVANRKFALVLAAFTAGKKLAFHDTETCESGRSVVSWVRLIK